jgi:hypothetical protein
MTAEIELARPRVGGLAEKMQYAKALAVADLLPGHFKRQPANVLWAVEYAEALRLPTIAAITGVHVMDGKPTPSAALMSALVRRAGHRLRLSHDPSTKHGIHGMAWCEITRVDDPDYTFRTEWTIERAVAAELCEIKNGKIWHRTKNGKTGNWQKFPVAMMKARALSECARDACEEALMGMHYTAEELGADVDVDGDPITIIGTAERIDQPAADPDWASKPATQHERATGQPEPADAAPVVDEPVDAETVDEPDWDALIAEVERTGNVTPAWKLARQHRPNDMALRERIQQAGQRRRAKPAEQPSGDAPVDADVVEDGPAEQRQHAHMHVLWGKAGVTDRDERLAVTAHLIGHDITSSKQLTFAEAELVIERLRAFDAAGKDALVAQIDRWLGEYHAGRTATDEPAEEQS